jgi:hypothetical protein
MEQSIKKYLASIGQRGGVKSRRKLTSQDARIMTKVREARRAYRKFHSQCFWSFKPDLQITIADIPWVSEQLMKQGGRAAWEIGAKLCL